MAGSSRSRKRAYETIVASARSCLPTSGGVFHQAHRLGSGGNVVPGAARQGRPERAEKPQVFPSSRTGSGFRRRAERNPPRSLQLNRWLAPVIWLPLGGKSRPCGSGRRGEGIALELPGRGGARGMLQGGAGAREKGLRETTVMTVTSQRADREPLDRTVDMCVNPGLLTPTKPKNVTEHRLSGQSRFKY